MIRYNSVEDLSMRLKNTIVRYRGEPVFIDKVTPDLDVRVVKLLDRFRTSYVDSSHEDLDISSPPLGFMNNVNEAGYIFRTPRNTQKQGVVPSNLTVMLINNGRSYREGIGWETIEDLIPIGQSIAGIYPSFEEVVDMVSKPRPNRNVSQAFSRDWAMVSRHGFMGVYHKTIPVALYYPAERRFTFKAGALTKTRMLSLRNQLPAGGDYGISERN